MAFEVETYYEIDQYLKGELQGEEFKMFTQKMNNDPEFAQLVKTQQVANQIVITKGLSDLKEKMAKDLANESYRSKWTTWLMVIVGVVSISTVALFFVQDNPKKQWVETPSLSQGIQPEKSSEELVASSTNSKENLVIQSKNESVIEVATKLPTGSSSVTQNPISPDLKKDEVSDAKVMETAPHNPIIEVQKTDKISVNCDAKNWEFKLSISPTCQSEREGAISITDKQNNLYSFDGGATFERKNYYTQLEAGDYQVFVKDENGCVKKNEVEVPSKNCLKELDYAFDPNFETWNIPLKNNNLKAELKVFAKNGQLVFLKNYDDNSEHSWDGKSNNGEFLSRGLYTFMIHYADGSYQKGNISITY